MAKTLTNVLFETKSAREEIGSKGIADFNVEAMHFMRSEKMHIYQMQVVVFWKVFVNKIEMISEGVPQNAVGRAMLLSSVRKKANAFNYEISATMQLITEKEKNATNMPANSFLKFGSLFGIDPKNADPKFMEERKKLKSKIAP